MALFGSLGLSIPIWPFGLILDLFGSIYPKEAGGPQLFFGPLDQEALNIWRGKLFHFFQILCNHMYPKVIVISIVDLQKTNNFTKFGGCC